nr:transposase [Escherichia coli]
MGTKVSDMQKNVTPGRRKGCPNYPPEFKQQLVAASCEPGISISKLALENGINANLLFKWRQQWREGKLLLPSSESPQLLPVTLDAAADGALITGLTFLAPKDATRVQGFFQHLQVRFGDGPWQDVKGLDEVGSDTGRTGE